jgi:uncharacterized protein involved in response to NO
MTVWLLGYTKRDPLLTYYGSSGWHAHEMLFGYMVAVMAGLLSIMMRNQSGEPGLRGMPLLGLVMLWLAGRALPVMPSVPPWLVALVDISFLPILTLALAVPLIRAGRKKELSMVLLLLILTAADVLVHLEWLGYVMDSARLGVVVAIYTMVLFVTLSAGRVMPWFIKPGLEQDKRTRRPVIDYASAISVVVLALADLFSPEVKIVIVCAMLAAAIHAWRWMHWLTRVDWSQALLWVLMAGYAWLIVGFVMTAISYGGHISHMIAFHALMVGGFGGLTLGMMAWAALAHGGAPQRLSPLMAIALVMLNIAAVVRIVGPLSSFRYGQAMITAAGALWIISFVLFLLVYAPIFMQARAERRKA